MAGAEKSVLDWEGVEYHAKEETSDRLRIENPSLQGTCGNRKLPGSFNFSNRDSKVRKFFAGDAFHRACYTDAK